MIEPHAPAGAKLMQANLLQPAEHADPCDIRGVNRKVERQPHMTLSREVIDLIRPDRVEQRSEIASIGQVAVMQIDVRRFADAGRIAWDQPMNGIAFLHEQLG